MNSLIPEEMKRNGRAVLEGFKPEELLFFRFDAEDLEQGELSIQSISIPDQSTNWSRLGPAEWLRLCEYPKFANCGLVEIAVNGIPPDIIDEGGTEYRIIPTHVPLEENYPHSEIRIFKSGNHISYDERRKLSKTAKLKYRDSIRRRANPTSAARCMKK